MLKYLLVILFISAGIVFTHSCKVSNIPTSNLNDTTNVQAIQGNEINDESNVVSLKAPYKINGLGDTLIDSLKNGFTVVLDGSIKEYITLNEVVPEILKKVFPDVTFLRIWTGIGGEDFDYVLYLGNQYDLKSHFNILFEKVVHTSSIDINDKICAAVQILSGLDKNVLLEKVEISNDHYNYKAWAKIDGISKIYFLRFYNSDLKTITDKSGGSRSSFSTYTSPLIFEQ